MSRLWNRQANIIFAVRGEQGVKHSDIRIVFDVEKTSEVNTNSAKIKIYNLNKNSRAILQQENVVIILEVGYENNVDQLYVGDIIKSSTEKIEGDLVTSIEAKDGGFALENANLDKSYKAGTNIKDVAKDVIKSMEDIAGITVNSLDEIKDEVLQNGMSITGASRKTLDNIIEKQGLEYSIQDNELQIIKKDGSTAEDAVLLTPETGLLGKPIEREKGIQYKALIQTTKIRPGRRIRITSSDIDGVFINKKVNYKGDTHGSDWFVLGEAVANV
jgi:hypothetical protein